MNTILIFTLLQTPRDETINQLLCSIQFFFSSNLYRSPQSSESRSNGLWYCSLVGLCSM